MTSPYIVKVVIAKRKKALYYRSMNVSIIYFSLSGRTKMLSQYLAEYLKAEGYSVEINPLITRNIGAFVRNCIDAFTRRKVNLEYIPETNDAEILFLGSPVWAFDITPAMYVFLEKANLKDKKVFLYNTYGSGKGKDRAMALFCRKVESNGGKIIGKTDIKGRRVKDDFATFKETVQKCLNQS